MKSSEAVSALLLLMSAWNPSLASEAPQPVRSVDIYVTPYYSSGASSSEREVAVGAKVDALLDSDNPVDVRSARDQVVAESATITPMTMMVLASRLYDIGDRDDSVFWFYVAKDRFTTLSSVIDGYDSPAIFDPRGEVVAAMSAFVSLAGPTINGYAFCDIANQQAIRRRAFDWVKANPYAVIFVERLSAKGKDRQELLASGLARIEKAMSDERDYLADKKNAGEIETARKENGADTQYCWKA